MFRKNCSSMLSATAEMNMPIREVNSLSKMPRITASSKRYASRSKEASALLLMKQSMIQGIDYGKWSNEKSYRLLKPGAEKICRIMNLRQKIFLIKAVQDGSKKIVFFVVKVELINFSGLPESEGVGTCNSGEQKFSCFNAFDIANIVLKIAHERALIEAINTRINVQELLNGES